MADTGFTVRGMRGSDLAGVCDVARAALVADPVTPELFARKVFLDLNFDPRGSVVAESGGRVAAFLTGFVFALFRYGLALIPFVALRVNTKKVAAVVSLGVALFYLLLSGANVATERAFIMISVMLGARDTMRFGSSGTSTSRPS